MAKYLKLIFNTEEDGKKTISISNPKEDLTDEQVNGIMDTILEKDVFTCSTGKLVSKAAAKYTTSETDEFTIAE